MEQPDWAKVLQVIYDRGGRVAFITGGPVPEDYSMPPADFIPDEKKLIPNQYLDEEDTLSNFRTLKRVGLVGEVTENDIPEGHHDARVEHPLVKVFELTQEGFNVAHERELRKQQETHNRVLTAFTVLVGISALIQAVSVVATQSIPMQLILGFISISGALAFAYVLKGRAEIFTG